MLSIELTFEDEQSRSIASAPPLTIGKVAQCEIRIANWRVGRQHARLSLRDGHIVLEDMGTLSGTLVNRNRVSQHQPVMPEGIILIGPCRIRVSQVQVGEQPIAR